MKALRITIAAALAAVFCGVLAASAGATTATPAPVTFNGTVNVVAEPSGPGFPGAGTSTGTWIGSGAVTGSFAVSQRFMLGDGTIHIDATLTGATGTITMRVNARFVSFVPPFADVQGDWTITSGTGSYASLHGSGDYAATVDVLTHVVTESLTGFALYDAGS